MFAFICSLSLKKHTLGQYIILFIIYVKHFHTQSDVNTGYYDPEKHDKIAGCLEYISECLQFSFQSTSATRGHDGLGVCVAYVAYIIALWEMRTPCETFK